jgi:type I restriction enzyme, S subunit
MNWHILKDVFEFLPKSKIKAGDGLVQGSYPFFTSSPAQTKFLDNYLYEPGCIVFGTGGNASVHLATSRFATSTDCFAVRPVNPEKADSGYLYHFFRGNIGILEDGFKGAGLKHISKAYLSAIQIPLPPLAEQKRIAAILDAADALRTKRREALAQLDALLQSTFLTLFGDPVTNPMGLPQETLETAFQFTTGKLDSNAAVEGGRFPFFTCARETFAINNHAFDCEALLLAGNNANADYSVKYYKGKFNAYQRTYVITLNHDDITYKYAHIALEYMLGDLKRFSKGSNTKYLTMGILNKMPILLPPLPLQQKFAAIVESIERQKTTQRAHLAELDALFAALQHRAFRGEL